MDGYDPAPIPGTEGGFDPFFSPDGESVGFFTFDALLRVPLRGGPPITLAAVVNPVGGTWCDDGSIYFAADEGAELWRLPGDTAAARAEPVPLTSATSDYPHCLPGSTGLLLTVTPREDGSIPQTWPLSADAAGVGVLPLPPTAGDARMNLVAAAVVYPGRSGIVGIRPHDVVITAPGEGELDATVELVQPTGSEQHVHL